MKTFLCIVIVGIVSIIGDAQETTSTPSLSRCPTTLTNNEDPKYLRRFGNKCYEFVIYQERYWDQAHSACASKKGHLVTIPDNYTQEFLMRTLNHMGASNHGIWIGLNDRRSEGTFEWDSGDVLTYTYWRGDHAPYHTFINSVDDCFTMRQADSWKWEDFHCHLWPQHYGYICEYDVVDPEPKETCNAHKLCSLNCANFGFKVDNNKCPVCACNHGNSPIISAVVGK